MQTHFVAGTLIDNFQYHLALYRQHQRPTAAGIALSRQTLTSAVLVAAALITPLYYAQLSSILQSDALAMDEPPIKAGRADKGKLPQGFFWPPYGDRLKWHSPTELHEYLHKPRRFWESLLEL